MEEPSAKELIRRATEATGLSVKELAERMGYPTLPRTGTGEFPLPDSKRRHLNEIIRLSELEKATNTSFGSRIAEVGGEYGGTPREKLQAILRDKQWSPARLAREIKYDSGVVANVVEGTGRMSEAMAEKIVEVLDHGLTVAELLDGSETPRVMDETGRRGTHGARALVSMPGGGKRASCRC